MALLLSVATFAPAMPSGSNMRASIDRPVDSDAVTDPSGTLGLSTGTLVCEDGLYEMVSVTNSYGIPVDVTIQLANDSGDVADLYFNGSFVSDSVTFTLSPGDTRTVNAFASCAAQPSISYDAEAVGPGINTDANGRIVTVVGLNQNWPQFSFDERNIGVEGANTGPRSIPNRQWTYSIGGATRGAPVMADDTIFVGSQDNDLYAINAHNGSLRWRFTADGEVTGAPAYESGTVYFGTKGGTVYAVDASSGNQDWSFTDPQRDIESPVVVENGVVYTGSKDKNLYAIEANSGNLSWSFNVGDEVRGVAAEPGGYIYTTDKGGDVFAVNSTGDQQWTYAAGDEISAPPVVSGDRVFFGTKKGNQVYALNATNGSGVWIHDVGGDIETSVAVESNTVYASDSSGTLYALDVADGSEQWTSSFSGKARTAPAIANGTIYLGSDANIVYGFNSTGFQLFAHSLGGAPVDGIAVAENYLYVGDGTDTVYALYDGLTLRQVYDEDWPQFGYDGSHAASPEINTGPVGALQEKWTVAPGNPVVGGPVISDGSLYIGESGGGNTLLYARHESNGSLRWTFSAGGETQAAPAVNASTVYVGDKNGNLYGVWTTNGTQRWSTTLDREILPKAAPAVHDGTIFVGTKAGTMYAVWENNGTVRWQNSTGNEIHSSPAAVGDTVYYGDRRGQTVYARWIANGTLRWSATLDDEILSSVVVDNGTVYAGTKAGSLYALDAADGSQRWTPVSPVNEIRGSPAVEGDRVFVGDKDSNLAAVWTANGTDAWSQPYQAGGVVRTLAVVDERVYGSTDSNAVFSVNATTGAEDATFPISAGSGWSIAVANGHIYVGDGNGNVYAIEET